MNIESVVTAISFGFLSFFMKRFIDKFDQFEDYSRKNNKELDKSLHKIDFRLVVIENKLASGVSVSELDKESREYLKVITEQVKEFNRRANKIEEDYGTVIWLKNEQQKQDAKIVALFNISKKLHLKQVVQGLQDVQSHSSQRAKKSNE